MAWCNCLFWLIILLLMLAGVAYLLGADDLGELALDLIRLIIILLLVAVLVGLILVIIGYFSWSDITDIPFLEFIIKRIFSLLHLY